MHKAFRTALLAGHEGFLFLLQSGLAVYILDQKLQPCLIRLDGPA